MTTDGLTQIAKQENIEAQLELLRRVLPQTKNQKLSPMKINSNEEDTYQLLISAIEYINYLNNELTNWTSLSLTKLLNPIYYFCTDNWMK